MKFKVKVKNKVKNKVKVKVKVKNNDCRLTLGKFFADEIVCVDVVVAFDFAVVFDLHPLLTTPIVLYRKWIKKALLFEPQASFNAFPFFVMHNWEPEGRWLCGRLSLLPFFGEAKKGSGSRATPGLPTTDQPKQSIQRQYKNPKEEQKIQRKNNIQRTSKPQINARI